MIATSRDFASAGGGSFLRELNSLVVFGVEICVNKILAGWGLFGYNICFGLYAVFESYTLKGSKCPTSTSSAESRIKP